MGRPDYMYDLWCECGWHRENVPLHGARNVSYFLQDHERATGWTHFPRSIDKSVAAHAPTPDQPPKPNAAAS